MGVKEQKHVRKMDRQPKRRRRPALQHLETRKCGHRRKLPRAQPRPAGASWGHRPWSPAGIICLEAQPLTRTWALGGGHKALETGKRRLQTR